MLDSQSAVKLIRMNIELENQINPSGDLIPLPDSTQVAYFIIALHSGGCETFFRHNLPLSLRKKLASLSPEQALFDFEMVKRILATMQ